MTWGRIKRSIRLFITGARATSGGDGPRGADWCDRVGGLRAVAWGPIMKSGVSDPSYRDGRLCRLDGILGPGFGQRSRVTWGRIIRCIRLFITGARATSGEDGLRGADWGDRVGGLKGVAWGHSRVADGDVGAPNPRLRPPARRIFLQPGVEHRFFPLREIQIGFDHDTAEFFEPHCGFPAEDSTSFFGIADE